jgi:hypothetical protein|tara:strand:+ start:544 stop:798 length:255 start_codon:yes stop_codon:yes gene_type:complete
MTDKEAQIKEGREARALLENPILIRSYEVIQNQAFQDWLRTGLTETDKREAIYHSVVGTLKSQQVLVNTVENGKLIEDELKGGK